MCEKDFLIAANLIPLPHRLGHCVTYRTFTMTHNNPDIQVRGVVGPKYVPCSTFFYYTRIHTPLSTYLTIALMEPLHYT